jgi:ABC-2 type transport system permease protein
MLQVTDLTKRYGEYWYGGRSAKTRSTSRREVLPLLYELAGKPIPTLVTGEDYLGYPLIAGRQQALLWFFGGLPLLIVLACWWTRWAPRIPPQFIKDGGQS